MPQYIGTIMTEHEPLITPTEINLHKNLQSHTPRLNMAMKWRLCRGRNERHCHP